MIKSKSILVITLFIICPFLSLPFVFIEIYNKKKYAIYLLALFMGLISMYYFPWGDQYSYFNDLEACRFMTFDEKFDFSSIMIVRELNLINIFIFCAAKIGLNLEIIRFLLTIIGTSLIFSIFVDLDNNGQTPNKLHYRFILFVILWLSVPYYLITYGFRNGFGACIVLYGVYRMYVKNEPLKGLFCFLLAVFVHYSYIIHTLIFIFIFYFKGDFSVKKTLVCAILMYLLSMTLFSFLYGYIPFLDTIMDFYVYGDRYGAGSYDWSSSASKELWLNGVLNTLVMFLISFKLNMKHKLKNLVFSLFILCSFSLSFPVLFQRVIRTLVPILALYLIFNYKKSTVYKAKYIVVIVLLLAFIYPFILHREKYAYAHFEKILYYPLPMILSNHYDSTMIDSRVDSMGSFY